MKKILPILLTLTTTFLKGQQDPQYSQYQFNQMVINPAYAGSRDALSGVIDGRYQWGKLDNGGSPQTISFSFHSPLKKKRIGLGLSGYSDKIGPRSVTGVYGSIAYILPLSNKLKLSFGLRGGVLNYKFDWNAITFKDPQENMSTSTINPNQTIGDMDAGFYLKSNSFYCGLSATHLNAKSIVNETNTINGIQYNLNYPMQRHFFFVISKGFKAGENLVINPTIMIKNTKGISSTDINLNFLIKKRLWLGTFLRTGGTIGLLAQVYATDKLRIGYAFDRSLNPTQNRLGSGHEIMIGFDFNTFKATMLSPRYL